MDFLWHKVSDKEKEDIKNQAKAIMDSFSKKLEKVSDKVSEPIIEREKCERNEGLGKQSDESFKKSILDNAPEKNNDFIVAERGGW